MPTVRDADSWEILDSSGSRDNWLKKLAGDLTKASTGKQLAVGGASGFVTGYVSGKVSKAAAVTLGGTLLILQVANHQGYIHINWNKVKKEVDKAKKELAKQTKGNIEAIVDEVKDFVQENVFLAGGFAAGFLIGLAS